MKKFKKVIPALCMLLVSAIMLGSTTYAWFSMNNNVTASGMTVSATTNTKFLIISNSQSNMGSATTIDSVTNKTGGINNGTSVYPCAKNATESTITLGGVEVATGKWYTANSKAHNDSASVSNGTSANISNVKVLETSKLGDYQIKYTFYIALADGSYTGDLKFTNTNSEGLGQAEKAIVTINTGSGDVEVGMLAKDTGELTASDVTLGTSAATVTVTLYVDGNDSSVKGNSASSITGKLDLKIEATGIKVDGTT